MPKPDAEAIGRTVHRGQPNSTDPRRFRPSATISIPTDPQQELREDLAYLEAENRRLNTLVQGMQRALEQERGETRRWKTRALAGQVSVAPASQGALTQSENPAGALSLAGPTTELPQPRTNFLHRVACRLFGRG